MKFATIFCLLVLASPGLTVVLGKTASAGSTRDLPVSDCSLSGAENIFNLADFGAVGDGVADCGPALQNALNAIADSGGGTLFVPAGRYAIVTPVQKDFTGMAASVTILGVESLTPVPPPNSIGLELAAGLDLVSEFAPRTGEQGISINITGLQNFLIKDITFIGTAGVNTDASITLALNNIREATIRHCEFYGLSSVVAGGAIVDSVRSGLSIDQSVFLGSTGNSAVRTPVVQNLEWKAIAVTDSIFLDYGTRPELYGKLGLSTPYSWILIGNAAAPESDSPRRQAVISNVFFDEGAIFGLASLPYLYLPPSAPIDLVYVSGIYMNVSNLASWGTLIYGPDHLLIEDSHYGWSHNSDAAITLQSVGNAILDRVECLASANRIRADAATGQLTVINSVYTYLDSESPATRVVTTANPEDDPVQYVRQKFDLTIGRQPDPAAHFYWSDRLLQCGDNLQCLADRRAALDAYLDAAPSPSFSISGLVADENGAGMAGVTVTVSGSQSVATQTGDGGEYTFAGLPTSGVYEVTPSRKNYTFKAPIQTITTPSGDQTANFSATVNRHDLSVRILDAGGNGLPETTVLLSGSRAETGVTDASGMLTISALAAGGDYTVTPEKTNYSFSPARAQFDQLDSDQTVTFTAALVNYTIGGQVGAQGTGLPGATVALSGSQSATTTADANGNYSFTVLAEGNYTVTPAKTNYLFSPASASFQVLSANQGADFEATLQSVLAFSEADYNVTEGARTITVTVTHAGNTSAATEVIYSAVDGSAGQRSDVIPVIGRLQFEPGETSKSFIVFITDDAYVEGDESLTLQLNDPVGSMLGNNSTATITITDNDSSATTINPLDGAQFFVRQHYRDFLNRPPDAAGLAFWSDQILSCGTDAACIADRRLNVSAAFFLSIEFQQTGFLVYRVYRASYGQAPHHLDEFLLDTRTIGAGVVVNSPGWGELLEGNKAAFFQNFVGRLQFTEAYPLSLTPEEFVNLLNTKTGNALSSAEVAAAVAEFQGAAGSESTTDRARALRHVAENETFSQHVLNPAFVLMQYFGYLQRDPNEAPDTNLDGYNFWLHKLEEFGGDFRRAEMVKSFLVSAEYRERFGTP